MTYQPPPRLGDVKTCGALLRAVRYFTQMEGMAVLAAYQRRRDEDALSTDEDYVALGDEARMRWAEEAYVEAVDALAGRSEDPVDEAAFDVLVQMWSGERLWYRVGARWAQRIERTAGRAALVRLIEDGPTGFAEQRALVPR
jgi:Putative zinc dependent peptidase (DUF5700)